MNTIAKILCPIPRFIRFNGLKKNNNIDFIFRKGKLKYP